MMMIDDDDDDDDDDDGDGDCDDDDDDDDDDDGHDAPVMTLVHHHFGEIPVIDFSVSW